MVNELKEPRGGDITLGGIPWLARMIDKARLEAAGEIDALDLEYPCPMDQSLLRKLNLPAKDFQELVLTHSQDEAILEALAQRGVVITK